MKLGRVVGAVTSGVIMLCFVSCASIVSKSDWPITLKSNPSGAEIIVRDKNGNEIHRGLTPTTLTLQASSGFFQPAKYDMELKLDGYNTGKGSVTAGVNGWYFGNIVFGGLIGLLIVDPATGAMFKLPPEYTVDLVKKMAGDAQSRKLAVISVDQVPGNLRGKLIRMN